MLRALWVSIPWDTPAQAAQSLLSKDSATAFFLSATESESLSIQAKSTLVVLKENNVHHMHFAYCPSVFFCCFLSACTV